MSSRPRVTALRHELARKVRLIELLNARIEYLKREIAELRKPQAKEAAG